MVYKWSKHLKVNLRNESIDINNVPINCNTDNTLHNFFVFKILILKKSSALGSFLGFMHEGGKVQNFL